MNGESWRLGPDRRPPGPGGIPSAREARGRRARVTASAGPWRPVERDPELIALDDALRDLEKEDPREGRVVVLHVFGGLSFQEVAEELGIARATAMRDWTHAKLWLRRQLGPREPAESG